MFRRIEELLYEFAKNKEFERALDVGSFDINGSVRRVIGHKVQRFIGIDMREGPGVDVVMNGHDIIPRYTEESFDLITCCETLEHDDQFWLTVENMRKALKPGGWLFISTPSIYFFPHDFPSDYYRFTPQVYTDVFFKDYEDLYVEYYEDPEDPSDKKNNTVIGWARKPL